MRYPFFRETSEETPDWEEEFESCDEDEYIPSKNLDQISDCFAVYCERRNNLLKPTLEQAKQALIDRLIRQFWTSFRKPAAQAPHTDIDGMVDPHNADLIFGFSTSGKRTHGQANSQSNVFQCDDARGSKRLRTAPSVSDFSETEPKFACPYRKYDPRKYCVPNWGPCALTPLQTVARVK
jgi:hypothetical protein